MSSGERKKRYPLQGRKGWEEAGGEFYQECYPGVDSDLEAMQDDPQRICTLLPSKKTRCGTARKDKKLTTIRHRTTVKNKYHTNIAPQQSDIEMSLLPDLSENLSNEKLLWEEINKIKDMPINMSQKRELKEKLMSKDTLRLQGFKQFKWRNKKSMIRFSIRFQEVKKKITFWRSDLSTIEGFYGTGVVSFFLLLKWLIFLNFILTIIMAAFVIVPEVYFKHFSIRLKNTTTEGRNLQSGDNITLASSTPVIGLISSDIFDPIFNSTFMQQSPLFYSYYSTNFNLDLYVTSLSLKYAYLLATVLCFVYSLISVLRNAAHGFKHHLNKNQGQFYVYSNIIFSGWDHCVQSEKSARIKHRALYNEMYGHLVTEKLKEELTNRTKLQSLFLLFIRLLVNLFVVILLIAAGVAIFLSFGQVIEVQRNDSWYLKLLNNFGPTFLIVFFNQVFRILFRYLTKFERFSPVFSVQITIFRLVVLRFLSLCVLLATVHKKHDQSTETVGWESFIAQELYKILLISILVQFLQTLTLNLPRICIVKHFKNRYTKLIGKPKFYLPYHVIDVVYIQTIIWLGLFYSPLLPAFGIVILLIFFYMKKFSCLVICRPSFDIYCISRSHSLYMLILFISFTFCMIPWIYAMFKMKPSSTYGPFADCDYKTVWQVVENLREQMPEWINDISYFCVSSSLVIPLLIFLILTIYYYYSVYKVNKKMVLDLKQQLILEGHDKQFLLNRLSALIKQQHDRYQQGPVQID